MKFNFAKIASTAASTLMVGSTVALAAAASYPAPFAQGGVADVGIVYGTNAGSSDLVAATDIRINLENALRSQGAGSGGAPTGGDFVKLDRTSTKFHLGKGIADVISTTITDDDLEVLLADGIYLDDNNDRNDYTQKIILGNHSFTMFDDDDYAEDQPSLGMRIASNTFVLNYTLDFTDEPNWADLEQTDIEIMGKNYFILSVTTNTTLNLLDSSTTSLLSEGETVSLNVGGKSYNVAISFISTNSVKLSVNGEITNTLSEGQTYKLSDGSYIGIKDILVQDYAGGVKQVEFSLGTGKLELRHGQDVRMNENTINNLEVNLRNSAEKLQEITLSWTADDDIFVAEGSEALIPGFENLKLIFGEFITPSEETIEVSGASDYIQLRGFPLKDSTEDINLLYGTGGQYTGIGKSATNQLKTTNESSFTFDADDHDYFVATYDDGTNAASYLMRATNFITDNDVNKTTIQYRSNGNWVSRKTDAKLNDEVTIGDVVLTIGAIDKNAKTVVISGGSNVYFNRLYSAEGLKLWLPWAHSQWNYTQAGAGGPGAFPTNTSGIGYATVATNSSWKLQFAEEDKNDNKGSGAQFNATLEWNSATTARPTVANIQGYSVNPVEIGNSDIERSFIYSALATEFLWDKNGDQDSLKVMYHGAESYGEFFLAEVGATSGTGGVNLGSIVVFDNEVSSVNSKNLIVVGGSCVNSVASTLLGGAGCGSSFESSTGAGAGEFLIQTFASPYSGSKVATLVAGYNAADTTNAAAYLTNNNVDTTVGMKYIGTDANTAQLI